MLAARVKTCVVALHFSEVVGDGLPVDLVAYARLAHSGRHTRLDPEQRAVLAGGLLPLVVSSGFQTERHRFLVHSVEAGSGERSEAR